MISNALEKYGEGFIELRKIDVWAFAGWTNPLRHSSIAGCQGNCANHVQVSQCHVPARWTERAHEPASQPIIPSFFSFA